jgi:hypothetical protein
MHGILLKRKKVQNNKPNRLDQRQHASLVFTGTLFEIVAPPILTKGLVFFGGHFRRIVHHTQSWEILG